jgi:anthranilate phosphoribosyltransferase
MGISQFIKDIGRGKDGARSLSQADAYTLMQALLSGQASDLEVGAAVLALRMKGESVDELQGFLRAAHEHCHVIAATNDNPPIVVIPSYNGARKLPNLVPLLATLLAREGLRVLVHGITQDATRVTTHAIFDALGLPVIASSDQLHQVQSAWHTHEPAFVSISALSPALAKLLAVRQVVGVRNSAHTLVKLLAPFSSPCLRLANYTHPEYAISMSELLMRDANANTLLMRGTEGEAVADARRVQAMDFFNGGVKHAIVTAHQGVVSNLPLLPRAIDAVSTATYIQSLLAGEHPVPEPIQQQVEAVMQCVKLSAKNDAPNDSAVMGLSAHTGNSSTSLAHIIKAS